MSISITFISNFFNAHQEPVASSLASCNGIDYTFISLEDAAGMAGRENLDRKYPYVLRAYESDNAAAQAMEHAIKDDIVVFGNVDNIEGYIRERARTDKPFFRYSERLLKRGDWWGYMPPKRWRTWNRFSRYKDSNFYVLCASAFTSRDLAMFGFPVERCYKWGYFPQVSDCKTGERVPKLSGKVKLCSAQRLVPLKHVDLQIEAVALLMEHGYEVELSIAGDGECRHDLEKLAAERGVQARVHFLGSLSHGDTLSMMGSSDIFLATSDRHEGWGATVSEAMASRCAIVASDLIGSVPYLIRDGIDGFVFKSCDAESLACALVKLCKDYGLVQHMGESACERITSQWSASTAADRLIEFSCACLRGGPLPTFEEGPLSRAAVVSEDWHQHVGPLRESYMPQDHKYE